MSAALAAETSPPTTLVRGFRGEPKGGFLVSLVHAPRRMPLYWRSPAEGGRGDGVEKRPAAGRTLATETVTFVWSGAMGAMTAGGGFTISVNGHAAADCDVVLEPTQFPARKDCRLLYNVLYTLNMVDSSGHFYLTVPKAWVKPGEPAVLQVRGDRQRHGTLGLRWCGRTMPR